MRRIIKKASVYFSPDKKFYNSLRNILGFYPKNLELYKLAFRHKSTAKEIKHGIKNSNERLEFLGDAILSAVIAHYLFQTFPFKDEGFLTKLRSKLVSRTQLNKLAQKMGITVFIESNIDSSAKGNSINGDAFEALIGAIYLDKGYKKTTDFILNNIIKNHLDVDKIEATEIDFKSKLIEWAQKEKKQFEFRLVHNETPSGSHKEFCIEAVVENEALGTAKHYNKKRAEQLAAEHACKTLDLL